MLNTLKTLPRKLADNPVAVSVQEAAVNVWAANVNVLVTARDESAKVMGVVVAKARAVEERQLKALKETAVAANDRVNDTWSSVEQVLAARVVPLLDKVGLAAPLRFSVGMVDSGLAKVSARVVEMTREAKPAKRVTKKVVVKKVVARKPVAARRSKLAA